MATDGGRGPNPRSGLRGPDPSRLPSRAPAPRRHPQAGAELAAGKGAASQDPDPRTSSFTTGIIAQIGPISAALFFTGQNHAGENLNQLLQRRAADLAQPLQICDALSRHEPQEFPTLLCNCLLHARRNFIDLRESFPEPCRHVIASLRDLYRFEAQAKEAKLSPQARLHFHQEHSQPVMDQLREWLQA